MLLKTIKISRLLFINLLTFIVLFDIFSATFLRGFLREFNPTYLQSKKCNKEKPNSIYNLNKNSPYADLKPNLDIFDCSHPKEKQPTKIITDIHSCRIGKPKGSNKNKKSLKHDVYFMGDSFTFSSTNYEFSIPHLYEQISNKTSLNCGVGASGTIFQFKKFKQQISLREHIPQKVILLIYENDFYNDYFDPDYTVENKKHFFNLHLYFNKFNEPQILVKNTHNKQEDKKNLSQIIYDHSASMLLLKKFYWRRNVEYSNAIAQLNNHESMRTVEKVIKKDKFLTHDFHVNSFLTNKTIEQIDQWIKHSHENNYELIISYLPAEKNLEKNFTLNLEHYIKDQDIQFIDLAEVFDNKLYKKHRYIYDGHLKGSGNKLVANYLYEMIDKDPKEEFIIKP